MSGKKEEDDLTLNNTTMQGAWETMRNIHDSPNGTEEQRNMAWKAFDELVGKYKQQGEEE